MGIVISMCMDMSISISMVLYISIIISTINIMLISLAKWILLQTWSLSAREILIVTVRGYLLYIISMGEALYISTCICMVSILTITFMYILLVFVC
jgi:hypothetical protein